MKVLLDTHVLIWWLERSPRLSEETARVIRDPTTDVYVSMASAWEMEIKRSVGKLRTPDNLPEVLKRSHFDVVPLTFSHLDTLRSLPLLHRDPFDRILIAQALSERFTLVTNDVEIQSYNVPFIKV